MRNPIDPKEVAKTNPAVESAKVERAIAFRKLVETAGVLREADYRLAPPLGSQKSRQKSDSRQTTRLSRIP